MSASLPTPAGTPGVATLTFGASDKQKLVELKLEEAGTPRRNTAGTLVDVMAVANQGRVWDPFRAGCEVPVGSIGDSAAQIHNATALDSESGVINVQTVIGKQTKPVGEAATIFGLREAVKTSKAITSLPQALIEKDILGHSNFATLPTEVALGPCLYKRVGADILAFPTGGLDEIMQVPVDLESARANVKDGIIFRINVTDPSDSCEVDAHDLEVNALSTDGCFDFKCLTTKLQSLVRRAIKKNCSITDPPVRVWVQSAACPHPPPIGHAEKAVDIGVSDRLVPMSLELVSRDGGISAPGFRILRVFFSGSAGRDEGARAGPSRTTVKFAVDSTIAIKEDPREADVDLCLVDWKSFTVAQLKEQGAFAENGKAGTPKAAPKTLDDGHVDGVLLEQREDAFWSTHKYDKTKGDAEARRKHRGVVRDLCADTLGQEGALMCQKWGTNEDYQLSNMERSARTGTGDESKEDNWYTDMIPVTVVGSRGEKAVSFWVTGKTGFPMAYACKDKTCDAAIEGYEAAKRVLGESPSVITPDSATCFEGDQFRTHIAKDNVSYEPSPPHCQNLNKAEPKWKGCKRMMRVLLNRKRGRFPVREWPIGIVAACWIEALFCGAVARRFGIEAEKRMVKNLAVTGTLVWVKDFSNPGATFASQAKKACYLYPLPGGIAYAIMERAGDGSLRLSVPMVSNNFKIHNGEWYFPDTVVMGPDEIFGAMPAGVELLRRKRGRPKKDLVQVQNVMTMDQVEDTEAGTLAPTFEPDGAGPSDDPWYVAIPSREGVESSIDCDGNVMIVPNEMEVSVDVVESLGKRRAMSDEKIGTHAVNKAGKPLPLNDLLSPAWNHERVNTFEASDSFDWRNLVP